MLTLSEVRMQVLLWDQRSASMGHVGTFASGSTEVGNMVTCIQALGNTLLSGNKDFHINEWDLRYVPLPLQYASSLLQYRSYGALRHGRLFCFQCGHLPDCIMALLPRCGMFHLCRGTSMAHRGTVYSFCC